MMEKLAECLGMRSNHPGTKPNALPQWRSFSTCKGERESLKSFLVGFGGEGRGRKIRHGWLGPTQNPQGRTVRGPHADRSLVKTLILTEPLVFLVDFFFSPAHRPLSMGRPSGTQNFSPICSVMFLSVLVNYMRTVRYILFRNPVICHNFEFEYGIIAHEQL
jgi:hypothetical protein